MITQRAYLIGGVGFCFYLIALVNTLPSFYYALTWLAISLLVSSFGIALLSLVGLDCKWQVGRACVTEVADEELAASNDLLVNRQDDDASLYGATGYQQAAAGNLGPLVEVELSNRGTLNKTGVMIEVQLLPTRETKVTKSTLLRRRFLLEALAYGHSIATGLPLRDLPRGRYRVSGLRLVGSDVLGLFRVQRRLDPAKTAVRVEELNEIIVGPAMISLHNTGVNALAGSAAHGPDATRYVGHSDEMRGTRFYVPGDDLRQVHWKSTARQGQLVVKEFHNAAQAHSFIVWDGSEVLPRSDSAKDFEAWGATEWGLRIAASLCRAMIDSSQPSTLLRLDSKPALVGFKSHGNRAPLTAEQVTKELAEADAARSGTLDGALDHFGGTLGSGGTVYLVTASTSPDVVRTVKKCHARDMRVVVALVDGSTFSASSRRLKAAKFPITTDAYATQRQALRATGAHVVSIGVASGQTEKEFSATIRSALHHLLTPHGERSAGRAMSEAE